MMFGFDAVNNFEKVFDVLRQVPISELPKLRGGRKLREFLPKSTVYLIQHAISDVFSTDEPRLLSITAHLHLDYVLGLIVDNEKRSLNRHQRESFHAKLQFLNGRGSFHHDVYTCLVEINRLRNSFAHNMFFDISRWNPAAIPYVQKHNLTIPKRKDLLRVFCVLVLRTTFLVVLEEVVQGHNWLMFEYLPSVTKSRRSRLSIETAEYLKRKSTQLSGVGVLAAADELRCQERKVEV